MFPYQIEYAKSSKSKCKKCRNSINKKELRIGIMVKSKRGIFQPIWHHEGCFFKNGKRLIHFHRFEKFNTLEYNDQLRIKALLVDPAAEVYPSGNNVCNNGSDNILNDREQALLSEYTVEKSKNFRATCRSCNMKIVKGDLRVSKLEYEEERGEISHWYHLTCFSNLREEFKFSVGGEYLPGFQSLSTEDKENVKNNIKPNIVRANTPCKKHKLEPKLCNDDEIRLQNEIFHKHKKDLRTLKRCDLEIVCKRNGMRMLKGIDGPLDLLADCMAFGTLERCPQCRGQLQLKSFYYECTGFRSEWSSCKYTTKSPRRCKMVIPLELQHYSVFKDYVPTVGVRLFHEPPAAITPAKAKRTKMESTLKKPLENLQFYIHGFKADKKEVIKTRILRLGGVVANMLVETVAAVFSTPETIQKSSGVVEKIEIGGFHVIQENFLDEIEASPELPIMDVISVIETCNIAIWACDILSRVPQDVIDGKPVRISGDMYTFKSLNPHISTTKVKDGVPVMADWRYQAETHVYCESGPYCACLNRVDVNSSHAPNISCTLQLLEADYAKRYWVVKSTGETGSTKRNITEREFNDDLGDAKAYFKKEFYEKTGNQWNLRHSFQKKHGKYDLVKLADLNNSIDELRMDSQSSLPATVQRLLILLLDINIINKTIADIDVDTSKMPLGVLADDQISSGYETLVELLHLVNKGKVSYNKIEALSNKFYTKIPHKGSARDLKVLNSVELIVTELSMLIDLRNTHISFRLLQEEMDKSISRMEGCYHKLKTEIVTLDKDSKEFNIILEYFTNTQSEGHAFKLQIEEIFKVEREGEMERYEPYKSLQNRTLLWHGSRLSNIAAILLEGLRISPPGVKPTGSMFGKGIYFAEVPTKSAQYIRATKDHSTGVLLLCEVALGNMKKCYAKEYITQLPDGVDSVWGVGRMQPDPSGTRTLDDGTIIPCGNIITNDDLLSTQAELVYNEFIIYNEAQVAIKYLLQLKFEL